MEPQLMCLSAVQLVKCVCLCFKRRQISSQAYSTVVGLHQTSRLQGCCSHSTGHHEASAAIKDPLSVLDLLHL